MNSMGSMGGGCIDLNDMASPSFSANARVEPKICEMCGKGFFRSALSMDRDCASCKRDSAAIEEAKAVPFPPFDGPGEDYWRDKRRKHHREAAEQALSMREPA